MKLTVGYVSQISICRNTSLKADEAEVVDVLHLIPVPFPDTGFQDNFFTDFIMNNEVKPVRSVASAPVFMVPEEFLLRLASVIHSVLLLFFGRKGHCC